MPCQDTELDNDVGDRALVLKQSVTMVTAACVWLMYTSREVGCPQLVGDENPSQKHLPRSH